MFKISYITKQIIIVMSALSLLFFGLGTFFSDNIMALFIGYLFGTVFSILKLILLEKSLESSLNMEKNRAVSYTRFHYSLRYILTGAMLFIAASNKEKISLVGVIVSLITLRPALYLVNLRKKM